MLAALGIVTALAVPALAQEKPQPAEDRKIEMTAEAVVSENRRESFVRPNIFYKIGGLDAYTFFEFYGNEEYFGKTMVSRTWKGVGPTGELVVGSDTRNRIGAGIKYSPELPEYVSLSAKFLPVWLDTDGRENRMMLGYSGSLKLPWNFDVSTFGEMNLGGDAEWGYGEISAGRNFGNLRIAYNTLLKNVDVNQGERKRLMPRVEHAFCASYKF